MRMPVKKIFLLLIIILLVLLYTHRLEDGLFGGNTGNILASVFNIVWGLVIITVVSVLILENRSPSKTLSWILILVFLPVIGFILYLVFGRNFRKTRIFARKEYDDYEKLRKINDVRLDHSHNGKKITDSPAVSLITRLLENNNKAFLTYRNSLEIYSDGKQAFDGICAEVEKGRECIHLQFFIIKNDETGNILKDLLLKKAREGLKVRLLYDSVGSWNIGRKFIKSLQQGGVETAAFSPVDFPYISSKMNFRNHRKIAIIDGRTGFLGGVNIADRYVHKDKYYGFWRDTHLKIEGEAVHSLQAIFLNDWAFATGKNCFSEEQFPEYESDEFHPLQIISSGPDSNWESIMQGYFAMITLASKNINIVSPYLVLNESMLTAIKVSALSGVKVRLIVPSKPDHHLVYWASRSYYRELLEAGIRIYEYQKGFMHSKFITVDGLFSSIGSANMDIRSFTQNMEVNAFVFSSELTAKFDEIFAEDLNNSKEVILEEYLTRSYLSRIKESFTRLFSPLL